LPSVDALRAAFNRWTSGAQRLETSKSGGETIDIFPLVGKGFEGASSVTINKIIREVLIEGLDDWVPVDRVIGMARESRNCEGEDYKSLTLKTIESLLKRGFVLVGEIGATGFEAWPGSVAEIMSKVANLLDSLEWMPQGAACWLVTTPLGDAQAELQV